MGWADRGIARELQPRLKLWGAISILGMVGLPKFGGKGVYTLTLMHFRAMEGRYRQPALRRRRAALE
jgi:hypothetical protein